MSHGSDPQGAPERKGMSTLAKVLLIGGGVVVTMVLALIGVGIWAAGRIAEEFPEIMEVMGEVGEIVEAEMEVARATTAGEIRSDINTAVVAVLNAMVAMEDSVGVAAGEEGSGVAFRIDLPGGTPWLEMDFVSVAETLDRMERGEIRFADVAGPAGEVAGADDGLPEWARIFPGARRDAAFHFDLGDFVLGGAVFIADAGATEVLEWYDDEGVDLRGVTSFTTNRATGEESEQRRDGHISLIAGNSRLSVLAVEDDHGDSLFVLLYRDGGASGTLDSDAR